MSYQLKPGFLSNVLGMPGLKERIYSIKVRNIAPANLIAYWQLKETAGTNADNFEGTAARDGTYTGVTLNSAPGPDGQPVPLFDGTNDYCNIFSASLSSAFSGTSGTFAGWCKVSGAGVWTDGASRYFGILRASSNNQLYMKKNSVNGEFQWIYEANNIVKTVTKAGLSDTAWFHVALTWDQSGDKVIAYFNGVQEGATQTTLGLWAGAIIDTYCNIGCQLTTPVAPFDGYLAHAAVWTTPLTPAQIAQLAVV